MAVSMQLQRQFDALHRDAQRVLTSIDNLSHDVERRTQPEAKAPAIPEESVNVEGLRVNIAALRQKVEETSRAITRSAQQIDTHVRNKPYPYLAGALGVGALAALVLERRLMHKK